MPNLLQCLKDYEGRDIEAWAAAEPPTDALALDGGNKHDLVLNRILAVVFYGLLSQPTVTHQIAYLQDTAATHDRTLAEYEASILLHGREQRITPAVYHQMIAVLRKWAQEIHDAAAASIAPAEAAE
jgi:hypothetical protein